MQQLLNRLAVCIVSVLPLFVGLPAYADESEQTDATEQTDADEPALRGEKCKQKCDKMLEDMIEDCKKIPARLKKLREACYRRSNSFYSVCLALCPKGPRDCLDEDAADTTSSECMTPLQSD